MQVAEQWADDAVETEPEGPARGRSWSFTLPGVTCTRGE
jgi:hypothetical protein